MFQRLKYSQNYEFVTQIHAFLGDWPEPIRYRLSHERVQAFHVNRAALLAWAEDTPVGVFCIAYAGTYTDYNDFQVEN